MTSNPILRIAAPVLALGLVAVACGGGSKKVAPTTSVAPSTTSSSTTVATTTTTSTVASSTTVAIVPTFPFTGLPIDDPARANRPALVVKVNNASAARPQFGLNQADMVFEEIVEGITRFFTIFQSTDAPKIGSIRSARTSDLDLLAALSKPLFVWSGGNGYVENAVAKANVTDIGKDHHDEIFTTGRVLRDYTEFFVSTEAAYGLTPSGQGAPAPIFTFAAPGTSLPNTAEDVGAVNLVLDSTKVDWTWDPTMHGWARVEDGTKHLAADGVQVAPANVVILFVDYRQSPADAHSPEAVTVGAGDAWVLMGGKLVRGTWSRDKATAAFTLNDVKGQPIALPPGHTWIELSRKGGAQAQPPV
jgi:hypothetical protein